MWEWSHSEEAYSYAREQLGKLPRKELAEIAIAWKKELPRRGKNALINTRSKYVSDGMLADWIWEHASSYDHGRNCSNGGHELYMDPQGYHTIDLRRMPKDWTPEEY